MESRARDSRKTVVERTGWQVVETDTHSLFPACKVFKHGGLLSNPFEYA